MSGETFGLQSAAWLQELEARREPVSPSTLATYRIHVRRLLSMIPAETLLDDIHNGFMRNLVARMSGLAPKTVKETLASLRSIVASAVDPKTLEPLFPRVWNHKAIGARKVKAQKQPSVNSEQIEAAIKAATTWQEGLLYAVLAGTGLRISECLSLRVGPIDGDDQTVWLADQSLIKVRSSIYQGEELRGRVKTQAAKRFVDLHSNLNEAIRKFVEASGIQAGEFLFQEDGNPLDAYVLRARAIRRGVPGFHSLRRFRISHLRSVPVLEDIIRYWVGHGPESITSLYAKLGEDVELRQQWATRAGLGFSLDRIGYPAPRPKTAKPCKPRKTAPADAPAEQIPELLAQLAAS
jgi:integrase